MELPALPVSDPGPLVLKQAQYPYNSPLAPLIAAGVAELESDYGDGCGQPDWNCKALYAEADGLVVGVLCWKVADWLQEAQIILGYVVPERRGQGIYTRLFGALEAEATRLKLRSITGYTSVHNVHLQAIALSQGRELFSLGYRKRLPFQGEVVNPGDALSQSAAQ